MNDQIFPVRDTDAEQIIAMVSALAVTGAEVAMLLPRRWGRKAVTIEEMRTYYETAADFSVTAVASVFPMARGVEKMAHGLRGVDTDLYRSADVIYTRNLPTVVSALCLSEKPVVYETYRPWPDQYPVLRPILGWIARHKRCLGAILHSQLAAKSFRKAGFSKEQLLVAHNGYNPVRMHPVLTKTAARRMLGLPHDRHIVTYTGNINMAKGVGRLLEMAHRMPETVFLLVGSRGYREVEQRAETIPNIRIIPWQQFSDTVPYLYAADVLAIPPTREPLERVGTTVLPLKTFLYMAAGRPIFGPVSPDLQEVLKDGHNAVLVDTDDMAVICVKLDLLLKNPQLQGRLAAQAAADVASCTWEKRAERILTFIKTRVAAKTS